MEPPESKKQEGWQVNDKPPAAWWNWFMTRSSEAIKELQDKAAEKTDITTINGEIDNLKQSGVDGKNLLETAIIAKEGTVSKQGQVATFEELDTGIRSIPTGTDTSDATAAAGDILAPKTAYGPNGKLTGTIPVLTGIRTATGAAKWPDGALAVYPEKGYQKGGAGDGEIKVTTAQLQAAEAALRSDNIKNGASIYGVPGKSTVVDTADAVLDPQYLLVGQSGYDDGVKKAGQMPNRSAENNHMPGLESTVWAGDRFFIRPPRGFYDGFTWVTAAVPGLTSANLRKDVNVAGLIGTLVEGRPYLSGSVSADSQWNLTIPVPGEFVVRFIILWQGNGDGSANNGVSLGYIVPQKNNGPLLNYYNDQAIGSKDAWNQSNPYRPGSVFILSNKHPNTWNYIILTD